MASKKKKPVTKSISKTNGVTLTLDKSELEFLRDIFGMTTPIKDEESKSVDVQEGNLCQMLGQVTHRGQIELELWEKITDACQQIGITIGTSAPSYAVSAQDVPTMYVYKVED